ncbi:uncharacterized protein LOC122512418 [Leptopilina heterotoma]|uniref:uncharacterized protein LOC122512418 n=1 Tax=Leptopilina heterotoma TaxID=63436 RepID=UPI001CA93A1F|nr:uncharacterized protein LOC122512418 [Leptopilina heterotoma]
MSISASFHKNVSLLIQAVPPSYDFKKHYRDGMFEKPNTAGFIYVSHYLLSIYDPDTMKKMIEWPVVCKKSEAKYRNDVKEILNVIANDNPDIGFPTVLPSLLLSPGGTKFTKVMWKLSQVALKQYIKRQSDHEVLFTPKKGTAEELTENLINNIIHDLNNSNMHSHMNLLKEEVKAREYTEEMNEQIKKTQKEIFEQLEIVSSIATKAPVHPSFQKKLLDIDDDEIIQMWKDDLKQMLDYCKKKIQILKNIEELSKIVFTMASNIISDTTVLNINFLPKLHVNTIAELPLAKIKFLSQNVYTNGNLNINNYFLLFNAIIEYFGSHIKNNGFLDFYNCLSQLEASNSDLKIMKEYFCELHAKVVEFSSYTQQKPEISTEFHDIDNESLIAYSKLKNVMFMPSPPIQFNSNERHEVHNRLKLTPVEGVHKQLFLRYNKNKDGSMMNASKVRQNLVITRINFDDTISSDVEKSPCRRFAQPKTIWTTSKPVGKYSRLFSNRLTQSANKTANCSILSIPSNSKANSTAMNIIGEVSSAELTIDLTMIEKKSTPKRGNKYFDIPEITIQAEEIIVQKACSPLRGNLELDVTSHKPCSPITSPVKNDKQKGRRRSITDLVERYKKLVQKTETTTQLKSVLDEES